MVKEGAHNANEPARLEVEGSGALRVLVALGAWTLGRLARVDAQIRELTRTPGGAARIDVSKLSRLDTAGAWLLYRAAASLGGLGSPVPIEGASDNARVLLDAVAKNAPKPLQAPPRAMLLLVLLERIGTNLDAGARAGWEMLGFSGLIVDTVFRVFVGRARLRINATVRNIEAAGFNAVPIIALMSFLIGAVMSFMSGDILKDYGGQIFAVDFLAFAFLREFGVLLASIMVAGRSGSAFTAEIGAMKSHEEIDAMRSLALDPVEILVVPRVLALIIALPLLTFIANMAGLLGGALVDLDDAGYHAVRLCEPPASSHRCCPIQCRHDQNAGVRFRHRHDRLLPRLQGDGNGGVGRRADDTLRRAIDLHRHRVRCALCDVLSGDQLLMERGETIIKIEKLVNRFGAQTVHDELDLEVRRGEIIGIVGGSGSGKSVLLRSIIGLNKPVSGRIEVFGEDLTKLPLDELQVVERRWGVLFQEGALFSSLNVLQNVQVALREHLHIKPPLIDEIAGLKLNMVGLDAVAAMKMPNRAIRRHEEARGAGACACARP